VEWVVTESGARMPLDTGTHRGGGVTELGRDAQGRMVVRATPDTGTRRSHFASCPNAKVHRQ